MRDVIDRASLLEEISVEIIYTERSKHATEIARNEANSGSEVLIAVGGDGTCNEVINGIMGSSNHDVVFGILPNGTGNDFHRMLGNFDADIFLEGLQNRKFRKIDLCELTQNGIKTYALNIAGTGFDGHVIKLLTQQRKKWNMKGKFSYTTAIARAFFSYKKPTVRIVSDEFTYEGKMLLLAVCNGSTFGHGLQIQPGAKFDDGLLNIALFGKVSLIDYVRNLSKLKKGIYTEHPEVTYFSTKEVEIQKTDGVIYCEADGELVGQGTLKFRIVPAAIHLLEVNYIKD